MPKINYLLSDEDKDFLVKNASSIRRGMNILLKNNSSERIQNGLSEAASQLDDYVKRFTPEAPAAPEASAEPGASAAPVKRKRNSPK
ncbi:MAG TPA: hypothetical protein VEB40_00965 [Flavipsychrobacter sp.]|nr:hypothetical protein [Flavipsychrobacter sp.]